MQQTVRGIHFKSAVWAGFAAAYLMYFVDNWFAGALGLFGLFPGWKNLTWMLGHHIDGILFALPFAVPAIYDRLPGGRAVKGLVYGLLFMILVGIVIFIGGALGASTLKGMQGGAAQMISMLLLHLVYGFFLGLLYNPGDRGGVSSAGTV
jgi:hypothetical protein